MKQTVLITTVLLCLATAASAADGKKDAQPQSGHVQQMKMTRTEADAPMTEHVSRKDNCDPGKPSSPKNTTDGQTGDPDAAQNRVEYGGGG